MNTFRLSSSRYLIVLPLLGFASGCSSDPGDDHDTSAPDKVTAVCDAYEALNAECGYSKFESRAGCDQAFRQQSDAELDKALAYYVCLGACKDGSGQTTLDDVSDSCYAMFFQAESQAAFRAACEPECNAVVAAGCSGTTQDECMSSCARSWGSCPDEVLAIAQCGHTYACTSEGTLTREGCAAEDAAFAACYNRSTPGAAPQPQPSP